MQPYSKGSCNSSMGNTKNLHTLLVVPSCYGLPLALDRNHASRHAALGNAYNALGFLAFRSTRGTSYDRSCLIQLNIEEFVTRCHKTKKGHAAETTHPFFGDLPTRHSADENIDNAIFHVNEVRPARLLGEFPR